MSDHQDLDGKINNIQEFKMVLVGTGSLGGVDPDRIILKKVRTYLIFLCIFFHVFFCSFLIFIQWYLPFPY